jgi:hypothetical protein
MANLQKKKGAEHEERSSGYCIVEGNDGWSAGSRHVDGGH